ncbi:heavy metal-associated domain-containing protein [Algibacter sp. AS12]|uniref:heavy-metal-associated domain-containing protein n=1 Tax=Algibacter sp. AS12 TaxID=3135773 RepID=UPI00398B20DB
MKSIKLILTLALVAIFAVSCKNDKSPEVKTVEVENAVAKKLDPNAKYAKAEFTIDGMTCQIGCAATIQKKISKMDGVKSATVSFDKKLAMVEYDEAKVTPKSLEDAVVNVADVYKVSNMKTVNDFSKEKACAVDCKKACCADKDKKACEPGCEKSCCKAGLKEGEKMACKPDCKEACCIKKEA